MRGSPYRCLAALLLVSGVAAGCGGPKRLPPVETGGGVTGRSRSVPTARPVLPALLQVGLLENQIELQLTASGSALVLDGDTGLTLKRLAPAGDRLRCRRVGSEVDWQVGGDTGRASAIVLQPVDPADLVRTDEASYRGEFLIVPSPSGGGLTLINGVDLEAYLQGVVPWEIGRHGPDRYAAVQAQAVAARTYTIAHIDARRDHGFDVFADVMDQVYKGAADEDEMCNRAVISTAGMVLRHGGREIEAYYSACCGGVSSNVEEVWAREASPYLTSREDGPARDGRAFCAGSKYFTWQETWTGAGLTEILQKTLPEYVAHMAANGRAAWAGPVFTRRDGAADPDRPGRLHGLEILRRTASGRVADLAVTTDAGVYHVRGDRVRWVLRPTSGNPFILRSALFELAIVREGNDPVRIEAKGRGFGHGIGLCQTGALARAGEGHTFEQILGHYYPGADLVRLSPDGMAP